MLSLVGTLAPIIAEVIKKYIHSKEEAEKIEKEITLELLKRENQLRELQAQIVKAEIQGKSWLQRNWRPLLMLTFILILFNNYVLVPYLSMFTDKVKILEFPPEFWNLLIVGVGGYIAGRSLEKIKGRD
ncbi:MAG: hypothetical protein DSY42_00490 [Aquifex sp.]|nr:MAG: hypothetical protein DSY42_00490 [Aquifex sp.]